MHNKKHYKDNNNIFYKYIENKLLDLYMKNDLKKTISKNNSYRDKVKENVIELREVNNEPILISSSKNKVNKNLND